jgi:hypothetical protein
MAIGPKRAHRRGMLFLTLRQTLFRVQALHIQALHVQALHDRATDVMPS